MQFQNPFLLFWLIHMLFSALKGYDELTTRKKGMGQWRHHDSPCCTSQANSHNFHYFWSIFWDFVTVLMILYYQSLHCNSVRQKRIEFLVFNIKGLYCKSVRICKKKYFIAIVLYKKKSKSLHIFKILRRDYIPTRIPSLRKSVKKYLWDNFLQECMIFQKVNTTMQECMIFQKVEYHYATVL